MNFSAVPVRYRRKRSRGNPPDAVLPFAGAGRHAPYRSGQPGRARPSYSAQKHSGGAFSAERYPSICMGRSSR